MTKGERKLWSELKDFRFHYGIHARKQVPIGPYIVDFAIHSARLVIEIDGEFHVQPDRVERDVRRDTWFRDNGYRVMRFTTGDLADSFDGCIEEILRSLDLYR
jgi:very-short-patch-repair endonuclease